MQLFKMAWGPAVCTSQLLLDTKRPYNTVGSSNIYMSSLLVGACRKIWYLSLCYAILQFGITAVVYFNPFIVGEQDFQVHHLVHPEKPSDIPDGVAAKLPPITSISDVHLQTC